MSASDIVIINSVKKECMSQLMPLTGGNPGTIVAMAETINYFHALNHIDKSYAFFQECIDAKITGSEFYLHCVERRNSFLANFL